MRSFPEKQIAGQFSRRWSRDQVIFTWSVIVSLQLELCTVNCVLLKCSNSEVFGTILQRRFFQGSSEGIFIGVDTVWFAV